MPDIDIENKQNSPDEPTENILNIQDTPKRKPVRKYNERKLLVLHAAHKLKAEGKLINSKSLCERINNDGIYITHKEVIHALRHYGYVRILECEVDHKRTNGCILKYKIPKKGQDLYKRLYHLKSVGASLKLPRPGRRRKVQTTKPPEDKPL